MTLWFDVEDLLSYFRVGHRRISGIQRLCFEICRAAVALGDVEVRFVRQGKTALSLVEVPWAELAAAFAEEEASEGRSVAKRREASAAAMQAQVVWALLSFGARSAAYVARRGVRQGEAGAGFAAEARPGDVLLVFGAPWQRPRYGALARWVRDGLRMRFGVLVHDLVPIRHPEWCHWSVPKQFRDWYEEVLPLCDVVFANSRHTAADVAAYARESGLVLGPTVVLPIGSGFAGGGGGAGGRLPPPGRYVLCVGTLEARKNHALLVRVWRRLLAEVAAGQRAAESVPDLVFAGGVGWLVADLLGELENTGWLGGRVRLIEAPSDAELRALYAGCMFTVFPSLHEGWGLPVTESLAFGKPCLASSAASVPEAGGALCRYFDPESVRSAYEAVVSVLDDPEGLRRWEDEVRAGFRPVRWEETARAVAGAFEVGTAQAIVTGAS